MNPLLRANILKEPRWAERRLVRCELCGVRVLAYDEARHSAHHEREARDQKLMARKARKEPQK